jgi:hypothetical protein
MFGQHQIVASVHPQVAAMDQVAVAIRCYPSWLPLRDYQMLRHQILKQVVLDWYNVHSVAFE